MLSFAVPITGPINTRRLTGFTAALCTAAERKRERLTASQSAGDQTLLMHSIWMPWFHLCWRGPCTQPCPSCWSTQQSSQARLWKRAPPKAFLLTCHCLHFLQHKPIHHMQKLDTLSVWCGNGLQFHIQRRLCSFPRVGGSVYVRHSCEVLQSLISVLTALLCYYWDGEAEGQCRCLPSSYQALSGPAGRSSVAWISPFILSLPSEDNIGEN